jgi:hypothetical protein
MQPAYSTLPADAALLLQKQQPARIHALQHVDDPLSNSKHCFSVSLYLQVVAHSLSGSEVNNNITAEGTCLGKFKATLLLTATSSATNLVKETAPSADTEVSRPWM